MSAISEIAKVFKKAIRPESNSKHESATSINSHTDNPQIKKPAKEVLFDIPRRGRPTKYKEEYCDLAYKFCLLGAVDADLARYFEVNITSLYEWKKHHPNFSKSLKEGREIADANVGKALYQRAIGYSCTETKVFLHKGRVITKDIKKHYPPDPASMAIWLKNRQRDKWRDNWPGEEDASEKLESKIIEFVVKSGKDKIDKQTGKAQS